MPTTADTLRLERELRDAVGRIVDQQTRDLTAAWVLAWDEISADLRDALIELIEDSADGAVSTALLLRNRRLQKALAVVAQQLNRLAGISQVRITADLQAVVDQAGAAQAAIIASTLPLGQDFIDIEAWSAVNPHTIDWIVRRATDRITASHWPLADQANDAVRRELIRGIAAGQNPRSTAARMVRRAEKNFNGGLTRALVIARTETLDAHRAGAELAQAQSADILVGWTWLTTLTARTCRSCIAQNGSVHPLSEPGPLDHQCGRCARTPTTRSWAELGFPDLDEPDDEIPNAADWFMGLSKAEQVNILGIQGWAAWNQGRWPMDQWSQRRQTQGWRDSFVVAPPPR